MRGVKTRTGGEGVGQKAEGGKHKAEPEFRVPSPVTRIP